MPSKGPKTRRGSAEYNRRAKAGSFAKKEARLHAKIKLHMNAIDDIEFRGNPTKAKMPRVAVALHRMMAQSYAKEANRLSRKRLKKGRAF